MKNDELNAIWNLQQPGFAADSLKAVLNKAKKQRNLQLTGIVVMSSTVLVLAGYALLFVTRWNNFSLGLSLMIGSLSIRVILELLTRYRKEQQLIQLSPGDFQNYLKKHYRHRKIIHFAITPLCFAVYSYGFYLLLPYFKAEFSRGFYYYLLISGSVSILVIFILVLKRIVEEVRFLKGIQK